MATDLYDIKELCAEAEVTPRTVHFYIQQGLLPPAGSLGPGARYDQGHVARLKLIKLLQKEHLPLSEIRQQLETLDDVKVQALVREHTSRKQSDKSSAVDYIRSVLTGTRHLASQPAAGNLFRSQAAATPPLEEKNASYSTHRVAERSQWERIVLAPDVELHIRRPLSRSQNRKIEALIQHARETLKEEKP
jgi:DNA-binding transcriptional MerR regulator